MATSTMYPSLAATATREGVTEYLSTTFALSDPEAGEALGEFLLDPARGIFRGPYVRVRLPFLPVPAGWENPLSWLPAGFRPYRHQARAFERLSTVRGEPAPTIVTTGTGSGKTESFLLPLLDHARRSRARGESGIKAIVLYPMNALVTDQARRIAKLVASDPALAGVTAGVYIGGEGTHTQMGADHLIDVRSVMRETPPDILLTNYRMLDLLLLRHADAGLWQASATSLQFIVLDEFHTYDGAQGTDVAMLLRRLGATLGVATAERPLGRICPVATSATLGSGSRGEELRRFAETVFGTPFDAGSLVGEERHGVEELFGELDFALDVPAHAEVLDAPLPTAADPLSWRPLAQVFLGEAPDDAVELGERLRRHILTRAVATAIGETPLTVADAVREVAKAGALGWGAAAADSHGAASVQEALLRFLALVSAARVAGPGGVLLPLVNVEVQLWIREVSRVLREVDDTPRFAWWSDGAAEVERRWLPAVYCRSCGSSGWQALATELGDAFDTTPTRIWQSSMVDRGRLRTLMPTGADNPEALLLETATCALTRDGDLPVLVTPDAKAAEAQRCPACGADDEIRFIGSAVATLVSVSLTQLFGLPMVPEAEKKTLVFTDSVQDAAHRAAFVEGRAFQFNFRSALLRAVGDQPASLPDVAGRLASAEDADLYLLAPPDFVRAMGYSGEYLTADRGKTRHKVLGTRLGFQSHLELGLRSRLGRTLELTGSLGVHVDYDRVRAITTAREVFTNLPILIDRPISDTELGYWLLGITDRLRARGGIWHPWLEAYAKDDGNRWPIWGGAPRGMQKFPRGRPAPTFLTTRKSEAFDTISSSTDTWLNDWTARCLGLPTDAARMMLTETIEAWTAASDGPLSKTLSRSGASIYGIKPEAILLSPPAAGDAGGGRLQATCPECHHVQPLSPQTAQEWVDCPCPRMRCTGRLQPHTVPANFYRTLYQGRALRRIIAREHTGLLERAEREEVETAFKSGDSPVAPNVLACTPTLELGIDIGDLSSVTLSSLPRTPANYLQRVGRAGRSTGNALILATVPTSPRDLYYFTEPRNLIAGEVLPPSAYLEATELLHRQYLAYSLDRAAAEQLPAALPGPIPNLLGLLFAHLLQEGTWLRAFTDTITAHADTLATGFLDLFGARLSAGTRESVRTFAATGAAEAVASTGMEWTTRRENCLARVGELNAAITALEAQGHLDDPQLLDLRAMRSERRAQLEIYESMGNQESLTGLSELSLLPNYNLIDDATTLDVSLWWLSDDADEVQRAEHSYRRGSRMALTEFAPGAVFYARGQKVTVDAVEPGPAANPSWRSRRLCRACGWGADNDAPLASCPRCADTGIADVGAVHRVLPFREASAEHSRDEALIDDDGEDRTRRRFATVASVDVSPADVVRAWRHTKQAFGAEYASRAVIRALNLGPMQQHGASVTIAGERLIESGFRTCVHCGKWWPDGIEEDKVRHRGWCPTRKGSTPEWVSLVLGHELVTQAVRLLLPVSVFDHTQHLVAMKGALLLGLRADFGGDPQHLDVVTASMPDSHGRPRRFLVLHDTVPGGTGYLDRIGDPERMRAILTKARTQLATCPCRGEGRQACHRCLLSVLGGSEIEQADRSLAVTLLDGLLADWDTETIDTVADIDISAVHLSELEKRFRAAVVAWAGKPDSGAQVSELVGNKGKEIDLTLTRGEHVLRWRIRPLVDVVELGVATQPDFLATRQDATDAPVAIYLDGKEFHASPENNRTADDARKRHTLRAAGYRVWSITWDDVVRFETTTSADGDSHYPPLVPPAVQNRVLGMGVSPAVRDAAKLAWSNPIPLLLAYLGSPQDPSWELAVLAVTRSVLEVAKVPGRQLNPTGLLGDVLALVAAEPMPAVGSTTEVAGWRVEGAGSLPLVVFARRDNAQGSLSVLGLLDDAAAVVGTPDHAAAWADWLHWANLAQFLPLPRHGQESVYRTCAFWTTESLAHFHNQPMPLAAAAAPPPPAGALSAEWAAAIDEVRQGGAPQVSHLEAAMAVVAANGVAAPEVGLEVGDGRWIVEVAWPQQRVAVVTEQDAALDAYLRGEGWTVLHADDDALAEEITKELVGA